MKIWKVKEERLGARIRRLQKRLDNIINSKLIPSTLKSKMILELKDKINECELEAGISRNNREFETFKKIENSLMRELDLATDKETEEKILAKLEFVISSEEERRNEILEEARSKYRENKQHSDRMRKIRGHKFPGKITMDEVRDENSNNTSEYKTPETKRTESIDSPYRKPETIPGIPQDTSRTQEYRENYETLKPREQEGKKQETKNTENKPTRRKQYTKKERLEALIEIARENGISFEKWENELAKGKAEEKCEKIKESIAKIDEIIAALNQEINKQERVQIEATSKIENLNTELKDVEDFKGRAEKRAKKSKEELDKTSKEDKSQKQKEVDEANKKLENANKKVQKVKDDLQSASGDKETSTKKLEELRKQLADAQKLKLELGKQYTEAQQELDEIVNGKVKDELPVYEEVPLLEREKPEERPETKTEQKENKKEGPKVETQESAVGTGENEVEFQEIAGETSKAPETQKTNGELVRENLHKMIIEGSLTTDDLKSVISMVEKSKKEHENGPDLQSKRRDDKGESIGE